MKKNIIPGLVCLYLFLFGQNAYNQGLEDIIVEKFYTASAADTANDNLPIGAVTYRIYVDLAEGYRLQTLFGVPGHPLRIETTTGFYNHIHGEGLGSSNNHDLLNTGNYCLDSWLTLNAVSKTHTGLLLSDDKNGSVLVKGSFNKADGMIPGSAPDIFQYELNLDAFNNEGEKRFYTENSILAVLGGVAGPNPENRILIAQITTDGVLSFELNVQLGVNATGAFEQYVAKDAINNEILFERLNYGN